MSLQHKTLQIVQLLAVIAVALASPAEEQRGVNKTLDGKIKGCASPDRIKENVINGDRPYRKPAKQRPFLRIGSGSYVFPKHPFRNIFLPCAGGNCSLEKSNSSKNITSSFQHEFKSESQHKAHVNIKIDSDQNVAQNGKESAKSKSNYQWQYQFSKQQSQKEFNSFNTWTSKHDGETSPPENPKLKPQPSSQPLNPQQDLQNSPEYPQPDSPEHPRTNPPKQPQPKLSKYRQPYPPENPKLNPPEYSQPNPSEYRQGNPSEYPRPNPSEYSYPYPSEYPQPRPAEYHQPKPPQYPPPNPPTYPPPNPPPFPPPNHYEGQNGYWEAIYVEPHMEWVWRFGAKVVPMKVMKYS